jgi:hypothetical protein
MAMEEALLLGTTAREPGCEHTRKDDQGRLHPSPADLAGTGRSYRAKSCKDLAGDMRMITSAKPVLLLQGNCLDCRLQRRLT